MRRGAAAGLAVVVIMPESHHAEGHFRNLRAALTLRACFTARVAKPLLACTAKKALSVCVTCSRLLTCFCNKIQTKCMAPSASSVIRVDEGVAEYLAGEAKPDETVGEALRRVLESKGILLPQKAQRSTLATRRRSLWEEPILDLLFENPKGVHIGEKKSELLDKVKNRLTSEELTGWKGGRKAWWYDVEVVRYELAQKGWIDDNVPRGIWRLTPAGRKVAITRRDRRKLEP